MTCLFVVTNTKKIGNPVRETGWYVPTVVYPFHAFINAGIRMTYCTPLGGVSPVDPESVELWGEVPICDNTLTDTATMKLLANTVPIRNVDASKYNIVLFAGGHGSMFDCANNELMNRITAQVYESGGIVAAIGHGTVGLLDVKLCNGKYLVEGQKITSLTNAEVESLPFANAFPFKLQDKLIEQGADFYGGSPLKENLVVSGHIITGQNPNSSKAFGHAVVKKYYELKKLGVII